MYQRGHKVAAAAAAASVLGGGLLAGCGGGSGPHRATAAAGNAITITSHTCGTGWRHPRAGVQTLQIHNASGQAIEVSLINAGTSVVYARVEGIGPGTTRPMPVNMGSGSYAFQCDGNNYGQTIGPSYHVPGHARGGPGVAPVSVNAMLPVTQQARAYVSSGLSRLMRQTAQLATDVRSGNLTAARAVWLSAHLTWTRLGSAYGLFGDYDDAIGGLPDGLRGGVHSKDFTGFYRLEYGLWHGQSAADLTGPASDLARQAQGLQVAWPGMALPPALTLSDLALRTHEVLENASRFQLSGQDNFGSGTTMATMAAAIQATQAQLKILHPLLAGRLADLPALYSWLDRLQRLVTAARTSHGWTPSARLSAAQRAELDAAAGQTVELLAEIPPMFETKATP
jgi:iron uptake system component EfeO